ncbi:hypothetical protein BU15DRAFT_55439, partial [Melanogaster broomeanus]
SAQWLRKKDTCENFLLHLGSTAKIIPFLPVSSLIQDHNWLRAIEMENGLSEDNIVYARWIKPIKKRAPGQRVAHTIFQLSNPQPANLLIRDDDESKTTRRFRLLLLFLVVFCCTRCAHCQKWGHITRDCWVPHNTCTVCGHKHRTTACESYRTYQCVSCNSHEHSSNDPHCPTYERKCEELDAKHPKIPCPTTLQMSVDTSYATPQTTSLSSSAPTTS